LLCTFSVQQLFNNYYRHLVPTTDLELIDT